ncbi:MAG: class I SAM-dependent methyltransferase [Arenicellales bacterium]
MLNRLIKSVANSVITPIVVLKRYRDATKEIEKVKKVESTLCMKHLKNTKILDNRISLLSKLKKGGVVAEVGVASGEFSEQILNYCKPKSLHLIDYWKKNKRAHGVSPTSIIRSFLGSSEQDWNVVNNKFEQEIGSGNVELHRGYSWDMLAELPDYSLDWVYIDAAHDYVSVSKDLEVARIKVKEDGIIAGHDYVRWGKFGYKCGVVDAVNEFCILNDYELLFLTNEARYPASFAIRKNTSW